MALQLTNYFQEPVQGNPTAAGLFPALTRGVEAGYLPAEKQQALQKSIYDNLVSKATTPYAPEMAAYDRDIKLAQAKAAPYMTQLNSLTPQGIAALAAGGPTAWKAFMEHAGQGATQIGSQAGYDTGGNAGYIPPPSYDAAPAQTPIANDGGQSNGSYFHQGMDWLRNKTGTQLPTNNNQNNIMNTPNVPQNVYSTDNGRNNDIKTIPYNPVSSHPAASALAKGLKLPDFGSDPVQGKIKFQQWYKSQPDFVKHAVLIHLHSRESQ